VTRAHDAQVAVTLCPGGPMLLRGATEVRDEDGAVHAVGRPVVALCRCHRSDRLPWCDSTHKTPRPDSETDRDNEQRDRNEEDP
jgi:CDGSH-type Zn-finger protein